MATLKPIKNRRSPDAEVIKLICDCGEQSWHWRLTQVGNQVIAECTECLRDFGPFFISPVQPVRPDDDAGS